MTQPLDMTPAVEALCPGCFYPRTWDEAAICPICKYQPDLVHRSAALLPVQTPLKRYVIGEKLGQGGFGITYRGFDQNLRARVAIKEYYPSDFVGRSTDRKTVVLNARDHQKLFNYGLRTFLNEARTLAQMKHPNLVRVLDYFEMNGTAYLVMDYYEGQDLTRYLAQQPDRRLPWRQAVSLLLPVLDGLEEVHQNGFMHRDVKPGNLYLTSQNQLILLDFGAARQVVGSHSRSWLIFSDGYAALEQYVQTSKQGKWTDVYGAAATLYAMLTAQRPPSAPDRVSCDTLRPIRQLAPSAPPALEQVLNHGLAVDPDQRLQSIVKFKRQLEAVLSGEDLGSTALAQPNRPAEVSSGSATPTRLARPADKKSNGSNTLTIAITPSVLVIGALLILAVTGSGWWLASRLTASSAPVESATAPGFTTAVPPVAPALAELQVFRDKLADGGDGPPMVVIPTPGREFVMGSPTLETGREAGERQHLVSIAAFAIGQTEVTFADYDRFCVATRRRKPQDEGWGREQQPVINVDWNDAAAYAQWLSEQTGQAYRLPTEAEWEYAARAESTTPFWVGNCVTTKQANYNGSVGSGDSDCGAKTGLYRQKPMATASFPANHWGLYDTMGNVWEWTCSLHAEDYGGAEAQCVGRDVGGRRTVRGGGWDSDPAKLRSASRSGLTPTFRSSSQGFRLVRSLTR